jgi:hypothetical protein
MEPLSADDPRQISVYRLQSRLGAGGMGRVYLASSPGGRAVAVKVVHPELARDPEFMRRFRREVEAAESVSGVYTAPVVGAGPDDSPPWLATAYVPGPSLAELVTRSGPLPEAAVWRLAGGLVEALQAIHARGLVHRDLKPGNILIAADGPRVIDFGISRALHGLAMTGTQTTMGTPAYMSPEQAEGKDIGPASDIFSLGSVLAFASTGSAPYDGGSSVSIIYRIVQGGGPDLSRVPVGLRGLVSACLIKDAAQRPPLDALLSMISQGSAAFPATAAGEFWPANVTALIAGSAASRAASAGPASGPGPVSGPGYGSAGYGGPSYGGPSYGGPSYGGSGPQGTNPLTPHPAAAQAGYPGGPTHPGSASYPGAGYPGPSYAGTVGYPGPSYQGGPPSYPGAAGYQGAPGYPPSGPGARPPRGSSMRWLALVGGAVIAAAAIGVALAVVGGSSNSNGTAITTPTPATGTATSSAPATSAAPSTAPASSAPASTAPASTAPASPSISAADFRACTVPLDGCGSSDSDNSMEVEPNQITDSGDGSGYIKNLTWTGWGTSYATATGTQMVNDCNPNCAQGTYSPYPATVTATSPTAYGNGLQGYAEIDMKCPDVGLHYDITSGLVP